jgi:hypothetical protein
MNHTLLYPFRTHEVFLFDHFLFLHLKLVHFETCLIDEGKDLLDLLGLFELLSFDEVGLELLEDADLRVEGHHG